MRHVLASLALVPLLAAGCSGSSSVEGQASYVKPAEEGGEPVEPQESSDDLKVTIALAGKADFSAVNAALCQLTSGDFSSSIQTSGRVGPGGSYESAFDAEAAGKGATNSLCGALENLEMSSVTSLTLSASLPANERNCNAFCEARASNECEAASDQASCRSEAKAGCTADCRGATKITGSGSASAGALTEANGALGSSGNVNAKVDLVFTAFE